MRVIASNDDEVGVVLTKAEAAIITAALSAHNEQSLYQALSHLYHPAEMRLDYPPLRYTMPMFDCLKKWVTGRVP